MEIVPELADLLAAGSSAVVTAPPGTGKSTAMPCGLLDRLEGRLFVTQPRRLAARMLASRSATLRGGRVGEEVGYAVRGDRRQGSSTRLLYLTEGLLLRRLLVGDGGPDAGDVVILDEFHERSIDADLVLGVLRDRGVRVVVASATLDAGMVSEALAAPTLSVDSRIHPVDVEHRRAPSADPPWVLAAEALAAVVADAPEDRGDVLIFMPGRREIDRTIEACRKVGGGLDLRPLHGGLSPREQDLAISPDGPRRVVVATNIAETSLTIPRVTTVIDSGLARIDRFDPGRDLAGLVTEPIDRASAVQRAGRAGRVRPGRCVRLYTESDFRRRTPTRTPATARADLADAFLRLRAAKLDPGTFPWIEKPPVESAEHASRTLESIGAVSGGTLTGLGRRMAMLPVPPRVARFLLDSIDAGGGRFAVACAAVLGDRDRLATSSRGALEGLLRPGDPEGDLAARARRLLEGGRRGAGAADVDARRTMDELRRQLQVEAEGDPGAILPALLAAFPDRVAFRRARDRDACALPGRRQAVLERDSLVRSTGFLVAASVRAVETRGEGMTVLGLATAVPEDIAIEHLGDRLDSGRRFEFDASAGRMEMVRFRTLDGRDIETARVPVPPEEAGAASEELLALIEAGEVSLPGWDESVESYLDRIRRVAEWFPKRGIPVFDDEELGVMRAEIVGRRHRLSDMPAAPGIVDVIRSALDWNDAVFVDEMAPLRLQLPGGRSMRITWRPGEPPRASARIGDLVGVDRTPTVGGGRVPVLMEILAPNRRPVQVTDDLPGFWERTYPGLKKELKRRYPRHPWP